MNDAARELQTAEQSQATGIIQVIERAALNPDVDVDKMERLLSMQERILERQAEQSFNDSMRQAQIAMPTIDKDADNQQTNSKYARYESMNRAIKPIYTEHGFSLQFGTDDSPLDAHIRIICDVSHSGGHTKRFHYDLPPDGAGIKGTVNKTGVHASASTVSYGKRYLAAMIFNLTIGGEDDDGNAAGGDTRSMREIFNLWVEYNAAVRMHFENISAIKLHIALDELDRAKEAWHELTNEERIALWRAPTKGGIFTTDERTVMKSNEWGSA